MGELRGMFDHIGIVVSDLTVARAFYSACLTALGIELLEDHSLSSREGWLVYGIAGRFPFFVVGAGRPSFWQDSHIASSAPDHLAFTAPDDRSVEAFYRAGLANGGRDNGPPGPRRSSTRCFAAFLIDPDGNNVEASHRG
jgi:catechol 2,3-dioxygenase-like lactoylglutathione lyase family enzyme